MTDPIGTYRLYSPADDCDREIKIYDQVDASHIETIDREWMPILRNQRQLAAVRFKQQGKSTDAEWQQLLGEYGAPDSHWDWRGLARPDVARTTHRSFVVMAGDSIEAIMVVSLTHRCEIEDQKGEHLVYVENLAVAPWNRGQIHSPRHLGGLGKVMLALAVKLSESEGWEGRVGLHSLAQAESFYENCNMTRVKNDSKYEDLWYFEFTPLQAKVFLS